LFYFLSPVQLRKRSDRVALMGTWHTARVNPPQKDKRTAKVSGSQKETN